MDLDSDDDDLPIVNLPNRPKVSSREVSQISGGHTRLSSVKCSIFFILYSSLVHHLLLVDPHHKVLGLHQH